jgi:hypothetical protein
MTSDIEELARAFLAFETRHDLFALRIGGHSFWDYIRYAVFYECVYTLNDFRDPRMLRSVDYLREAWPLARSLVGELLTPGGAHDILVVNYDRTVVIEGKNRNAHMYPFIQELAGAYSILLVDPSRLRQIDDETYPCHVLPYRPFHVLDRLKARRTRFNSREEALMKALESEIRQEFEIDVDVRGLAASVYALQLAKYERYRTLFGKYRPRMVVYADTANMKGVIAAAREAGIPTVDLQHSLISFLNILYNYPDDPKAHAASVRSDYVFTYGEYWKDEYRLPVRVLPVGYPYLEAQLADVPTRAGDRERNVIVIGMLFEKEILVQTAIELARLLPDHRIFYKLRIEDYEGWRGRYPPELRDAPNITVIDSNATSLFEYFAICGYQIGTNSGALYEGLAFDLTTFVMKAGWYAEMRTLIEGGHAFLASGAAEIAEAIRAGARPPHKLSREEVFRSESRKNIRDAVDGILAGRL